MSATQSGVINSFFFCYSFFCFIRWNGKKPFHIGNNIVNFTPFPVGGILSCTSDITNILRDELFMNKDKKEKNIKMAAKIFSKKLNLNKYQQFCRITQLYCIIFSFVYFFHLQLILKMMGTWYKYVTNEYKRLLLAQTVS